ncbi:MAG: UPF0149 family protein [Spirochaetes bacterium]|nr:UPF0149 family protein [Spirochaetota bacterium]
MTKKHFKLLDSVLKKHFSTSVTIQYLSGFFAAVIIAPKQINPDKWMPFLIKQNKIRFDSITDEIDFFSVICEFFNHISDSVKKWKYNSFISSPDKLTGNEGSSWCQGFFSGIYFWDDMNAHFEDPEISKHLSIPAYIHSSRKIIKELKEDISVKPRWDKAAFKSLSFAIPEIRRHFVRKKLIPKKLYYISPEKLAS